VTRVRFLLVWLALMAASAGCASTSPGLSAQASRTLDARVQAVRAAATEHNRALADTRLSQLLADVSQLKRQGQLTSSRATAILAAAAAVQAQLVTIPNPAPPPTTLAPPPPATTPASPAGDEKTHGNGDGGGGGGGGRGGE
jgi:predicted component of type VI protein secretion system